MATEMKTQEELKKQYNEQVKWFKDRVGKTIWRKNLCPANPPCYICSESYSEGLVLRDEQHAHYVADCSMEEGIKYFDSKQERDEYEAKMKLE